MAMSKFHEMLKDEVPIHAQEATLQACMEEEIKQEAQSTKHNCVRLYMTIATALALPVIQALDMMCMVVALPHIANDLDAFDRYSWFNNIYLLSMLAFSLAFSQWLCIIPSKHVAIFAVLTYEVGLLISAVAAHVNVMLVGRALSGVGAAGLANVAVIIVTELCDLSTRVTLFNIVGMVYALGGYCGALLGGPITQRLNWRWCFYINFPLGLTLLLAIAVLVPFNAPFGSSKLYVGYSKAMLRQLYHCDWLGILFLYAWGLALMISLQNGGIYMAWTSALEVLLLSLVGLLPFLFVLWEYWRGEGALLRVKLFRNRALTTAAITTCSTFACTTMTTNFSSIAYQALFDVPTWRVGHLISLFVVGNVVGLGLSTIVLLRLRYGQALLLASGISNVASAIMAVLCLRLNAGIGVLIGASVLSGVGMGFASQTVLVIVQGEFMSDRTLLAAASGCILFGNNLGRTLGPAIGGVVLEHWLRHDLAAYAPQLSASLTTQILHRYTIIRTTIPAALQPNIMKAYIRSVTAAFWVPIVFASISLIACIFGKWQRLPA